MKTPSRVRMRLPGLLTTKLGDQSFSRVATSLVVMAWPQARPLPSICAWIATVLGDGSGVA